MDKQQLETILEAGDLGPIEEHLAVLASERRLPHYALGLCVARIDESAPALRALLSRAAAGEWLDDEEGTLFFRGLHVLGTARDTQGFASLLRLLARPEEDLDFLLGDAVTKTLPRIVSGMFDGDAEGLFAAISDSTRDEYVRGALLGAATFLTWEGRIERNLTRDFLALFFDTPLAEPDDFAWSGWLDAVGLLGLQDLLPQAERVFSECRVNATLFEMSDLETLLAGAAEAPDDQDRFESHDLGYIDDVIVALQWTDRDEGPEPDEMEWRNFETAFSDQTPSARQGPVLNPWRHVGRNDPCPCGSGKKFKKCCLSGAGSASPDS